MFAFLENVQYFSFTCYFSLHWYRWSLSPRYLFTNILNTDTHLNLAAFFPAGSRNYVNRPYAQVRNDWIPTERGGRGSVVFPPSNTNAGQLNYQIQDAAKQRAAKDVVRSTTTTARSVYFQDYPELKISQPSPVKSGFRPSPEYPITIAQVSEPVLEKRENPSLQIVSPYALSVEYDLHKL